MIKFRFFPIWKNKKWWTRNIRIWHSILSYSDELNTGVSQAINEGLNLPVVFLFPLHELRLRGCPWRGDAAPIFFRSCRLRTHPEWTPLMCKAPAPASRQMTLPWRWECEILGLRCTCWRNGPWARMASSILWFSWLQQEEQTPSSLLCNLFSSLQPATDALRFFTVTVASQLQQWFILCRIHLRVELWDLLYEKGRWQYKSDREAKTGSQG